MSAAVATASGQEPLSSEDNDPPVSPGLEEAAPVAGDKPAAPKEDHGEEAGGSPSGGGDAAAPHSASHPPDENPASSSSSQDPSQQLQHQQGGGSLASANPAGGRRVTIGGIQGSNPNNMFDRFDRRGSLASATGFNVDDLFGNRRGSLGFADMGMDVFLPGRRGSMDSTTTALLDQAIFDLQHKRYSMAMGGAGAGGAGGAPGSAGGGPADPSNHNPGPTNLTSMGSLGGSLGLGSGYNPSAFAVPPPPNLPPLSASSIAARQQQLQEQQRDLERRQKELEVARQQLIASMQDRNSYGQAMMGGLAAGAGAPPPPHSYSLGPYQSSGSFGWGMGGGGQYGRSSLDLSGRGFDFSQRGASIDLSQHRAASMDFSSRGIPMDHSQRSGLGVGHPLDQSHRSSNSSSASQWWVCQVCNAKAFASHEEAMAHEAICHDGVPRQDSLQFSDGSHSHHLVRSGHRESMGTLGTLDSSSHSAYEPRYSTGPFTDMERPMPLAMPSDKDWLTPLHCFVRRHCVEVFTATEYDVATPSKGKRKPITVGQVGIRCPHCHSSDPEAHAKARERGSVYFPTTIASVYNATMNLLQRHIHSCTLVPEHIMRRYETLKADDARSGTSKKYWIESAYRLGLVDTPMGIRYCVLAQQQGAPPLHHPPLPQLSSSLPPGGAAGLAATGGPQETDLFGSSSAHHRHSNDFFSSGSGTGIKEVSMSERKMPSSPRSKRGAVRDSAMVPGSVAGGLDPDTAAGPLVSIHDKPYSTGFSYHLLSQMQPCVFTEADRLGKRKGLPPGYPGLACRHCFGGYGSGRFFPSSIKTLSDTSKTLNVLHNHMMRCRKCPADVRELLEKLRGTHDDERSKMKFGSQKAFFARIWDRLHGSDAKGGLHHHNHNNHHHHHHSMDPTGEGHPPPRAKGKRKAPPAAASLASHSAGPHPSFPMTDDSMRSRGSGAGSLDSMIAAAEAASELPPITSAGEGSALEGGGPSSSSTGALDALVKASDVKRQKYDRVGHV